MKGLVIKLYLSPLSLQWINIKLESEASFFFMRKQLKKPHQFEILSDEQEVTKMTKIII